MNVTVKMSTVILFWLSIACWPSAAQTNYVFSSYSCIPTSCTETGALANSEIVTVVFGGTCTGGAIAGINGSATIQIGNPLPCKTPYVPYASATVTTTDIENTDVCPPSVYEVDTVTFTAEVFNILGTVVYYADASESCDGSESGGTKTGTKPC